MRSVNSSVKPPAVRRLRIVKVSKICGGRAVIAGTRMPVWGLEVARRAGRSDAEILTMYPAIAKADLVAAWKWVKRHTDEIDRDIKENEKA
jgi:uncharacterized protein (DUF433 family)